MHPPRHRSVRLLALAVLTGALVLVVPMAPAATATGTRSPKPTATAAKAASPVVDEKTLTRRIKAYLDRREGTAAVSFRDLSTGQWYTYRPGVRFPTASVVKVDVLATLLLQRQRAGKSLTKEEKRLASRMIRYSDNDATNVLWVRIGGWKAIEKANKKFGLVATSAPSITGKWGGTRTTAADQIRMIRMLSREDSVLKKPARKYVLTLMRNVAPSQRWGVPVAADKGTKAANKNGWAPQLDDDGRWEVNSVGRVRIDGRLVAISILTGSNPTMKYGTVTATGLAKIVGSQIRKA